MRITWIVEIRRDVEIFVRMRRGPGMKLWGQGGVVKSSHKWGRLGENLRDAVRIWTIYFSVPFSDSHLQQRHLCKEVKCQLWRLADVHRPWSPRQRWWPRKQVSLSLSPFYQPFSRWTWFSRYQNVSILDFIAAKVDGSGGDNCSYKTCKAPVKMSPATNQYAVFFTGRMAFLSPNQQCQSTEGKAMKTGWLTEKPREREVIPGETVDSWLVVGQSTGVEKVSNVAASQMKLSLASTWYIHTSNHCHLCLRFIHRIPSHHCN